MISRRRGPSRAAGQNLQLIQKKTETILNAIGDQVAYCDTERKIIWANKAMLQEKGVALVDIVGNYCYKVRFGRRKPCFNCPAEKAMETGKPHEDKIRTPDGRLLLVLSVPVCDAKGKVTHIVEVTAPIFSKGGNLETGPGIYRDHLTGLYGRAYFELGCASWIKRGCCLGA